MLPDDTRDPKDRPPGRSRSRMMLLGSAILLCGMIIGAGLMATVLWERFQHSVRDPKRMPERIVDDMRDGLGLSNDQADRIRAIIARHRDEFEAIRMEMEPRIQAHMDQVGAEIQQVLTVQQREEWERRFARERHRWSRPPAAWDRHHGPRDGQGPPPPEPFPEGGG